MTLSNDKIIEIEELSSSMKQIDIAKKLNIKVSLVNYYLNKDKRRNQMKDNWKKKTLEQRRIIYKKRLPYLKEYQRIKYKTDESFRNKCKERSRKHERLY